jgi:hypothetical protein
MLWGNDVVERLDSMYSSYLGFRDAKMLSAICCELAKFVQSSNLDNYI